MDSAGMELRLVEKRIVVVFNGILLVGDDFFLMVVER